ncbi:MAG TPA: hypothetical protein VK781_11685 [Solirubrobacteraceae bacterium]|nr:hypothetical protein [Solirubrobacteraceae bacterium]
MIDGPEAEAVLFEVGSEKFLFYSHTDCRPSGVYRDPESIAGWGDTEPPSDSQGAEGGTNLITLLGMRGISPKPLLFVELATSSSSREAPDPFARYAEILGLHPLDGDLREMIPARAGKKTALRAANDHMVLEHEGGKDRIMPPADELPGWVELAKRERGVFLITGSAMRLGDPQGLVDVVRDGRCWGAKIPFRQRTARP